MQKSGYWRKVRISDWFDRLASVSRRVEGKGFSIVYRFYSTEHGPVKYVGRSDSPFSRASGHYYGIGVYGIHSGLGGRVTWVDFRYIVGQGRYKASYEEECRQYHWHWPDLNTNHPAKRHWSWACPVCGQ